MDGVSLPECSLVSPGHFDRRFGHDHVFTKCLSSFELTATSKTARHSHIAPLTFGT